MEHLCFSGARARAKAAPEANLAGKKTTPATKLAALLYKRSFLKRNAIDASRCAGRL